MDNKTPCYGCERRKPLCHGSCEDYKAFAQEKEEQRETLRKKRADEAMMDEVRFNTIHKVSKGTNKQTAWKG